MNFVGLGYVYHNISRRSTMRNLFSLSQVQLEAMRQLIRHISHAFTQVKVEQRKMKREMIVLRESIKPALKDIKSQVRRLWYLMGQKFVGQNCRNFGLVSKILPDEIFCPSKILSYEILSDKVFNPLRKQGLPFYTYKYIKCVTLISGGSLPQNRWNL